MKVFKIKEIKYKENKIEMKEWRSKGSDPTKPIRKIPSVYIPPSGPLRGGGPPGDPIERLR